ncbi:hypothetical protein ACWGB8_13910 [Kitasatospora sp. NPDC054939]
MTGTTGAGNAVLLATGRPFAQRVAAAARAWEEAGRGADPLPHGPAFFALYCWHQEQQRHAGPAAGAPADYLHAAYRGIGGAAGWDTLLAERAYCDCHGVRWRLENLAVCVGCLRYRCYEAEGRCAAGPHCETVG